MTTPKLDRQAVGTGKLKRAAVRRGKIADGEVRRPKIFDNAVNAEKIEDGSVESSKIADGAVESSKIADGAVSLQKLNTLSVAQEFVPRSDILYASVNALGQLQANNSRGAVSSVQISNPGLYRVVFNRDVSGCAWFPSRSAIGTGIPANGDFLGVGGETGQPDNVRVRIRDHNNNLANRSFSLLVVC